MAKTRRPRSGPITPPRKKRLTTQANLGARGVNLIERIVSEMGSRWNPAGSTEVGIDGYIELFEPGTGNATGLHLCVQSKAVSKFEETEDDVSFQCKREDIAYWLSATPNLILIVSRPETGHAYWLSARAFFNAPENAGKAVARFAKSSQRFTPQSYDALLDEARPPERVVVRTPVAGPEVIYCNLVPLRAYPPKIYVAASTCPTRGHGVAQLITGPGVHVPRPWTISGGNYIGFVDPSTSPLSNLIDEGTLEEHDSRDWAGAEDEDQKRLFVRLLNQALREDLGAVGIKFYERDEVFAFKGKLDEEPRRFEFQNLHQRSTITVVSHYISTAKDGREFRYLRHNAFEGRFRRIAGAWHLEITPTYRFTSDGEQKDRFHEQRLSGIKRLEGNRAVLSQVLLWNQALVRDSLFQRQRLLSFGQIPQFRIDRALPDADWSSSGAAIDSEPPSETPLPLAAGIKRGG